MIKISIVITTHRREKLLRKTLESIASCTVPDCPINLIVIENGIKGEAELICKNIIMDIPIHYRYLESPGTSNARKHSLTIVDNDSFVIFFDDDIIVNKNILESYYSAFQKFGNGYFYGGRINPLYEVEPKFEYMRLFPYSVKGFAPFNKITLVDEPLFLGANWAATSSDILAAGNFNPDIGPGGKMGSSGHEHDLQQRLLHKGFHAVYLPDAEVSHFVPREALCFHWLEKRYYKLGLTEGLNMSREKYSTYFGNIPRWFIRKFIENCLRTFVNVLRAKKDLDYHLTKLIFYKNLGIMSYFMRGEKKRRQ